MALSLLTPADVNEPMSSGLKGGARRRLGKSGRKGRKSRRNMTKKQRQRQGKRR